MGNHIYYKVPSLFLLQKNSSVFALSSLKKFEDGNNKFKGLFCVFSSIVSDLHIINVLRYNSRVCADCQASYGVVRAPENGNSWSRRIRTNCIWSDKRSFHLRFLINHYLNTSDKSTIRKTLDNK